MRASFIAVAALATVGLAAAAPSPGYRVTSTVTIGGDGGWDYLNFEPRSRHLFVTHGTHVHVLDAAGKVVGDIPDTPGVHGVAFAPDLNRGFISDGGSDSVTEFDLTTLATTAIIKVGSHPDAILYDPASSRVFTFNAGSSDTTAIDAATGTVAGSLPLGGKPEFPASDGKGTVYVNIEDKSELVAFDPRTLAVKARWPLAPCEEPSALAMDVAHGRLFVGCHNKMMAIVAADSGKVIATVPIGERVDAAAFDPATALAFSSNGDGTLTIVHEDTPGTFTVVQNVATQTGARTMALDPASHTVYLVTADTTPVAPTADNPHPRPTVVPGTFRLLIVGR